MVAQLTHIALKVQDIKRSIAFYESYCGMTLVHDRPAVKQGDSHVAWLSSPDYEGAFVLVLLEGRARKKDPTSKTSEAESMEHLGFAVGSLQDIFDIAAKGKKDGNLHWDVMTLDWPVGTLCALCDPDGNIVEFSYGQPIGFEHKTHNFDKPKHP